MRVLVLLEQARVRTIQVAGLVGGGQVRVVVGVVLVLAGVLLLEVLLVLLLLLFHAWTQLRLAGLLLLVEVGAQVLLIREWRLC